jgi:hypothetical protein
MRRIHRWRPHAKIIFIMRNPVDRSWSQFKNTIVWENLDISGFGFDDFARYLDSASFVLRSRYTRTIRIWEQIYPPEQLLYLFYDDIVARPDRILAAVCNFIGLDFDPAYFARTRHLVANRSVALPLPADLRRHLARSYLDEIRALHARFGGPAKAWLEACERTLAETA